MKTTQNMLVKTGGDSFQPVLQAQECEVRRWHDQAVSTSMQEDAGDVESVCNVRVAKLLATHRRVSPMAFTLSADLELKVRLVCLAAGLLLIAVTLSGRQAQVTTIEVPGKPRGC